jgi:hypothetical protein
MKTKQSVFFAALAILTLAGGVQSSFGLTLYWDPAEDKSGDGSGNWGGTNLWRSGSLLGVQTSWIQGSDATLDAVGSPGTIELIGAQINPYPASVGTLTVQDDGFVILSNNAARSLAATGVVLNGDLTLQKGSGNFSLAYSVGSGGISGTGDLTLNKSGTFSNNLTVNVAGDVSADTIITSTGAGLVGFVATENINISGNTTNGSFAKTLLAANPTKSLTLQSAATLSGSSTLQIGTSTNTGTVILASGSTVSSNISVVGGTLLSQGSNIIGDSSNLTLDRATLAFGNSVISETLGTLTLTQNSVIDLGGGAVDLHFAASDVGTWTGTLEIWNWTPLVDHVSFGGIGGTGLAGLSIPTGTQTGLVYGRDQVYGYTEKIRFYYGSGEGLASSGAGFVSSPFGGGANLSGEIVPVPEPSAILSLGLLLLVVGWKERRHFTRARDVSQLGRMANA